MRCRRRRQGDLGAESTDRASRYHRPSDLAGVTYGRIGIEAGPLSQWLVNALTAAELPVICVETRHMKALLTAQQINKTDRNDARGIAQMMRVGHSALIATETVSLVIYHPRLPWADWGSGSGLCWGATRRGIAGWRL